MAQIKQLCCLGLGAEATAPALTRLLLRLVPGLSASVLFKLGVASRAQLQVTLMAL